MAIGQWAPAWIFGIDYNRSDSDVSDQWVTFELDLFCLFFSLLLREPNKHNEDFDRSWVRYKKKDDIPTWNSN